MPEKKLLVSVSSKYFVLFVVHCCFSPWAFVLQTAWWVHSFRPVLQFCILHFPPATTKLKPSIACTSSISLLYVLRQSFSQNTFLQSISIFVFVFDVDGQSCLQPCKTFPSTFHLFLLALFPACFAHILLLHATLLPHVPIWQLFLHDDYSSRVFDLPAFARQWAHPPLP